MEEGCEGKKIPVAVILLFILTTIAGALLLICWSLKYHESNDQLWMVPVSFVFLGSPVISCLSFFASGRNRDSPQFLCKGPVLASDREEKTLV